MTILITGCMGFIGSAVSVKLLNNEYNIVGVDDLRNSNIETINRIENITGKRFPFYQINLLDEKSLQSVFKDQKIDAVMHFAGSKSVPESLIDPILYYQNNVSTTINILKVMEVFNVYNLIFSSSASVYGNSKNPISENFITNPAHIYGKSKIIIENILFDVCDVQKEWKITSLRYFNPVGAINDKLGEDSLINLGNLFPTILKVISGEKNKLHIYGDGTNTRDFIHITDLAIGHIDALKKIGFPKNYNTYNLGTGIGISILSVIKCFEKIIGKSIPVEFVAPRHGDVMTSVADPSKVYHELGWKATKTLQEMCESALLWDSQRKKFKQNEQI